MFNKDKSLCRFFVANALQHLSLLSQRLDRSLQTSLIELVPLNFFPQPFVQVCGLAQTIAQLLLVLLTSG
jgi:hypothetical protein